MGKREPEDEFEEIETRLIIAIVAGRVPRRGARPSGSSRLVSSRSRRRSQNTPGDQNPQQPFACNALEEKLSRSLERVVGDCAPVVAEFPLRL